MNSRLTQTLTIALCLVAGLLMAWSTSITAPDFTVYFEAARRWWAGQPVYPCGPPEVMAFKYPPWILPVFLPFGRLSPDVARWAWGFVEAISLWAIAKWLWPRVRAGALAVTIVIFWGILSAHAFDGQISLTLTALGVWTLGRGRMQTPAWLVYPFSAKVFTWFPLLGLKWRARDFVTAAFVGFLFLPLSFPALRVSPEHSWTGLMKCWQMATGTALDESGRAPITVAGDQAQGFVSLVARALSHDVHNTALTFVLTALIALIVALFWSRASRTLLPDVTWAGWLALTATVQPLAGFHSFVLALPLAAMVLDQTLRDRRHKYWWLSFLGLAAVALLTQKTLGAFGLWLQLASIKSFGVLALCVSALKMPGFRAK